MLESKLNMKYRPYIGSLTTVCRSDAYGLRG